MLSAGRKLRVLALTQDDRMPSWDLFYQQLGRFVDLDFRKLTKAQQRNLKKYFQSVDIHSYDRIFFDLRFKKQLRQRHLIASLPRLVEFEHDANQNYKVGGKYQGKWTRYYRTMQELRVLSSGFNVSRKLAEEGFDVKFIPKGYDESEISCLERPRDIEFGFIGRIGRSAYDQRRDFLQSCVEHFGLQLIRTHPGGEYNQALNRIKFFISADIGLGEYMIKNFEAMAAGCVLCCYRQGNGEEEALGLVDMENVVLYQDIEELTEKLDSLSGRPDEVKRVATNGRLLAEREFKLSRLAEKAALALQDPLTKRRCLTPWQRLLAKLGH